ncbi:hypothetical protein [Aminipila sp.]|uniref:hypothetical protein n=1 Tax=Aminipila sp. TaxID=2060095 RepID=UPI00289B14BD|nr:hypothetical protein [Aminipila sp.]
MKTLFKMGQMKPESVAKGIFICVAIIIIYKIPLISILISRVATMPSFINIVLYTQYYLEIIGSTIIYLILLRLFCELLYNILSAAQVIIKRDEK